MRVSGPLTSPPSTLVPRGGIGPPTRDFESLKAPRRTLASLWGRPSSTAQGPSSQVRRSTVMHGPPSSRWRAWARGRTPFGCWRRASASARRPAPRSACRAGRWACPLVRVWPESARRSRHRPRRNRDRQRSEEILHEPANLGRGVFPGRASAQLRFGDHALLQSTVTGRARCASRTRRCPEQVLLEHDVPPCSSGRSESARFRIVGHRLEARGAAEVYFGVQWLQRKPLSSCRRPRVRT